MRVTRRLHLLLAPHGLAYLAARIRETYGDGAHRIVSERPYELTSVFGVGFLTADRIARRLGVELDSPDRTRAAVLHVLSEAERGGSTCMPLDLLLASAERAARIAASASEPTLDELVDAGDLVRDEQWIYRTETAELEAELAERVQELVDGQAGDRLSDPGLDDGIDAHRRAARRRPQRASPTACR